MLLSRNTRKKKERRKKKETLENLTRNDSNCDYALQVSLLEIVLF